MKAFQEAKTKKLVDLTLNSIPDHILWIDKDGNIVNANKAASQYLGYTQQELLGKTIFYINPELNRLAFNEIWNQLHESSSYVFNANHQTKDGRIFPVQVYCHSLQLEEEAYISIIASENMSESRFDSNLPLKDFTIDSISDMVFWANLNGEFIFANSAATHNLGYANKELLSLQVWDIVADQPRERWLKNLSKLKQVGRKRLLTKHRRKNGTIYPTDTILHYCHYKGEEYICATVRNDEELKDQRAQLIFAQHATESSGDMVFWIDAKGQIIYANESARNKMGYDFKESDNIYVADIDEGHTRESYMHIWNKYIKRGVKELIETTAVTKTGERFPVETNSSYIIINEKEYNCSIVRDISRRRKSDKKLLKAMEEVQKLKDQLEAEKDYLKKEIQLEHNFDEIISVSPKYRAILSQIEEVAPTDATVLVIGETGTGKELIARAIHNLSNRSARALIKINCAVLPSNLIESELFGHERGAFTGAVQQKIGRFELANNATIFLDEIGELPLDLQAKLLRVLQEGEFSRLGSNKMLKTNVRVIAATNRNLENLAAKGKFREDLFYRLNVFPINNIPLRDRKEDITPLTQHFVRKYSNKIGRDVSKISKASLNKLQSYDFPGNIRELENIIERAVILSKQSSLNLDHWFPSKQKLNTNKSFSTLEELQRKHIIAALKKTKWRVSGDKGAAKLLGLHDKTLDSKMRKLGIRRQDFFK